MLGLCRCVLNFVWPCTVRQHQDQERPPSPLQTNVILPDHLQFNSENVKKIMALF